MTYILFGVLICLTFFYLIGVFLSPFSSGSSNNDDVIFNIFGFLLLFGLWYLAIDNNPSKDPDADIKDALYESYKNDQAKKFEEFLESKK